MSNLANMVNTDTGYYFKWFYSLLMVMSIVGCRGEKDNITIIDGIDESKKSNLYFYRCNKLEKEYDEKFHLLLSDLCSQELWNSRDCYDACSWLIIPMHYAFKSGDDNSVSKFHDLMSNFTAYCKKWGGV